MPDRDVIDKIDFDGLSLSTQLKLIELHRVELDLMQLRREMRLLRISYPNFSDGE